MQRVIYFNNILIFIALKTGFIVIFEFKQLKVCIFRPNVYKVLNSIPWNNKLPHHNTVPSAELIRQFKQCVPFSDG